VAREELTDMTTVDRSLPPEQAIPQGSQPLLAFVHLADAHAMEATVQAANAITAGPVSAAPVDFAVVNSELSDRANDSGSAFKAIGIRVPWLSVYGAHDSQLLGTNSANPERGLLSRSEHLTAHLASPGQPPGHGYGTANLVADICYYAVDHGDRVRVIVLDTVNPHGGRQGSLDPAQLSWLRFQLAAAAGRRVVLFSHHPLETLVNDTAPDGHLRILGDELHRVLLEHPCVVLWVNGHADTHQVSPVCREDGEVGFWQATTASQIDRRQQARVVELLEAPDGTVTIACRVFDLAAPAQPPQGIGSPADRDVILTISAASRAGGPEKIPVSALSIADELLALIDSMEELPYGGELVSQRAHALQCATLAVGAGGSDELVAAALLHDIGYTPWVQAAAPRRTHERAAATYLVPLLGEHVGWLVGHHVAAKRYLVAVDQGYAATLSDASRRSLRAQDGPASAAEIASWRTNPRWPEAVLLRSWDDLAKAQDAPTLPASWFRNLLAGLAAAPLKLR
jgi:predicted HD phosphohydrolase